jgi:undecaprenyl-diphosphatase
MLIIGGLVIIFYERNVAKLKMPIDTTQTISSLSVKELLLLGTAQAIAVIPGVSRSGAVIICGRALSIPKFLIVEFSFLLAIPTMIAATGYEILKSGISFSGAEWGSISIGFIISFITALCVVRWLLSYLKNNSFELFGWYRVILGVIMVASLLF